MATCLRSRGRSHRLPSGSGSGERYPQPGLGPPRRLPRPHRRCSVRERRVPSQGPRQERGRPGPRTTEPLTRARRDTSATADDAERPRTSATSAEKRADKAEAAAQEFDAAMIPISRSSLATTRRAGIASSSPSMTQRSATRTRRWRHHRNRAAGIREQLDRSIYSERRCARAVGQAIAELEAERDRMKAQRDQALGRDGRAGPQREGARRPGHGEALSGATAIPPTPSATSPPTSGAIVQRDNRRIDRLTHRQNLGGTLAPTFGR